MVACRTKSKAGAVCLWLLFGAGLLVLYWQPATFFSLIIFRDLTGPHTSASQKSTSEELADCETFPELRYTQTCIMHLGHP